MNRFRQAINQARNAAVADGIVTDIDVRGLDAVIRTPMILDPKTGQRIPALSRLEWKVGRLYRKETGKWLSSIDWSAVLQWLKDHIVQIITLVAAIIPFLL